MRKYLSYYLVLFLLGGTGYSLIEIFWRGYSHWSMFLLGGLCLLLLTEIPFCKSPYPLWKRCLAGAGIITLMEFAAGCFVNLIMGWKIWNYSNLPCNLCGQICLPFTSLWFLLCVPVLGMIGKVKTKLYQNMGLKEGR